MSDWIEVKAILDSKPDDWSPYADAFDRHGCPGSIQVDSPPSISAYLVDTDASEAVVSALAEDLLRLGVRTIEVEVVPEQDWSSIWKLHFKPMRVGKRFVVCPTWETYDSQAGDLVITLDPGQAFGTGDHATTRLCLEILEEYVGESTESLLDLGTGSGILAIGAKMLGAKRVDATDIDPIAVEVCRANCELNGVDVNAFAASGFDDPRLDSQWPIIVSNIISATLIRLAPEAKKRLSPGGIWIVSGILNSNWPDVLAACDRIQLTLVEHRQDGDWVGAVFKAPAE